MKRSYAEPEAANVFAPSTSSIREALTSGSALLERALAVYEVAAQLEQVTADRSRLAARGVGDDELPLQNADITGYEHLEALELPTRVPRVEVADRLPDAVPADVAAPVRFWTRG